MGDGQNLAPTPSTEGGTLREINQISWTVLVTPTCLTGPPLPVFAGLGVHEEATLGRQVRTLFSVPRRTRWQMICSVQRISPHTQAGAAQHRRHTLAGFLRPPVYTC